MFDITPYRKNDLMRDDFFSPYIKNFFDDDFFPEISSKQGSFKVDLKETNDHYIVEADLPGIRKEAINIAFNNNKLVISATRDESIEENKENYVRRERHYGEFKRSFYVDNVDESNIDASFNDGVLKITLPKLTKGSGCRGKIDIK